MRYQHDDEEFAERPDEEVTNDVEDEEELDEEAHSTYINREPDLSDDSLQDVSSSFRPSDSPLPSLDLSPDRILKRPRRSSRSPISSLTLTPSRLEAVRARRTLRQIYEKDDFIYADSPYDKNYCEEGRYNKKLKNESTKDEVGAEN